ncbi:uncharacterized protein LOC131268628 [Anopheles coustani]|uniref:uncharacterized protein LOC131268628 n=2 Tax=coustani group TaxID=59130 RepID=UPI00265A8CDB|nr:uncharacterized protein LOC131268628 [Anopheles coustani]
MYITSDESFEVEGKNAASVDTRQVVNLMLELHTELGKARGILKQMNPQIINPNTTEMAATAPPEVAEMLRAGAEAAVGNSFAEFSKAIKGSSLTLTKALETLKRIHHENASVSQPDKMLQIQTQCASLDQAENLLYTINLELREVLLAANASFVHGLWHNNDQLLETEGVKDALLRLLATLTAALSIE